MSEKVEIKDVVLTSRAEEELFGITLASEFKFENTVQTFVTKPVKNTCSVHKYNFSE